MQAKISTIANNNIHQKKSEDDLKNLDRNLYNDSIGKLMVRNENDIKENNQNNLKEENIFP